MGLPGLVGLGPGMSERSTALRCLVGLGPGRQGSPRGWWVCYMYGTVTVFMK